MPKLTMSKFAWSAVGAIIVAGSLSLWVAHSGGGEAQQAGTQLLDGVAPSELADIGLVMGVPRASEARQARFDEAYGRSVASAATQGKVLGARLVVLTNLEDINPKDPWRCLCWAVSIVPDYGWIKSVGAAYAAEVDKEGHPIGVSPLQAGGIGSGGFHVEYVDAVTGRYWFAAERVNP